MPGVGRVSDLWISKPIQRSPNGVTAARACLFRRPSLPPCPHRIPEASRSLFHRVLWTNVWTRGWGVIGRRCRIVHRGGIVQRAIGPGGRPGGRARQVRGGDPQRPRVPERRPGGLDRDARSLPRHREVGRRRRAVRSPRLGRDGRDGERRDGHAHRPTRSRPLLRDLRVRPASRSKPLRRLDC